MTEPLHVAVLAASRWAALASFDTRWRRVVTAWAQDPRVARLTVVDLPWFISPFSPAHRLAVPGRSWLAETELVSLKVPGGATPRLDGLAWNRAGRQLRKRLVRDGERLLVVATTPVSAPALAQLRGPATRSAFDAVDVWRMRQVGGAHPDRIAHGYACGVLADRTSCTSASIRELLVAEGAADPLVVPNGVSLQEFAEAPAADLPDLPEGPFCVYIGTIGHRLDVPLMREVWGTGDVPPLVLVGPSADADHEAVARSGPWSWVGPVPPESIPALLHRATVAVLPQRDTAVTEAQDYMKLFQYLASGVPVASTPLPGLPDDVAVGAGPAGYRAALLDAAARPRRTDGHPLLHGRDWQDVATRLLDHYLEGW